MGCRHPTAIRLFLACWWVKFNHFIMPVPPGRGVTPTSLFMSVSGQRSSGRVNNAGGGHFMAIAFKVLMFLYAFVIGLTDREGEDH